MLKEQQMATQTNESDRQKLWKLKEKVIINY